MRHIEQTVHTALRGFLARGLAENIRIEEEPFSHFLTFTALFSDRYRVAWRIGEEEIYNGDIERFLNVVEEGLVREAQVHQQGRNFHTLPGPLEDYGRLEYEHQIRAYQNHHLEEILRDDDWGNPFFSDSEADKKAEGLFRNVAGDVAWQRLSKKQSLPITGSLGTKYLLHKQVTYCVTRVSDKAKFCAVVPKVPLWDHLLGIKLMVEHDEPKFLKVANVSLPYHPSSATFPPTHPNYRSLFDLNIRMPQSIIALDTTT